MRVRQLIVAGLVLLLGACGSGPEEIRAVSGGMDCDEVAGIVDEAVSRAQRFIAGQERDQGLADDLVFALSGAEERPECVDEAVRSRAGGLRATLAGVSD